MTAGILPVWFVSAFNFLAVRVAKSREFCFSPPVLKSVIVGGWMAFRLL
jgi:hypothetical protein